MQVGVAPSLSDVAPQGNSAATGGAISMLGTALTIANSVLDSHAPTRRGRAISADAGTVANSDSALTGNAAGTVGAGSPAQRRHVAKPDRQ